MGGYEAVVWLIIERGDIGINVKINKGWTALLGAAVGGYEAVVRER